MADTDLIPVEWYDGTKGTIKPPKSWLDYLIGTASLHEHSLQQYPVNGKPYHMAFVTPCQVKEYAVRELTALRIAARK